MIDAEPAKSGDARAAAERRRVGRDRVCPGGSGWPLRVRARLGGQRDRDVAGDSRGVVSQLPLTPSGFGRAVEREAAGAVTLYWVVPAIDIATSDGVERATVPDPMVAPWGFSTVAAEARTEDAEVSGCCTPQVAVKLPAISMLDRPAVPPTTPPV